MRKILSEDAEQALLAISWKRGEYLTNDVSFVVVVEVICH